MPSPAPLRAFITPGVALCLTLATGALAPAADAQQFGLSSGPVAISLSVVVPPALSITGTAIVQVDTAGDIATVTERIYVRGNVAHQVVVRAVDGNGTEVRVPRAGWVPVSRATAVAVAETHRTGETTHLVQCRRPVAASAGCGLSLELVSTDPAYPATSRSADATR